MSTTDRQGSPSERGARLADALEAIGVPVRVEVDGAVAVLVEPAHAGAIEWPRVRDAVVRLARAHGFRAVALDLARRAG